MSDFFDRVGHAEDRGRWTGRRYGHLTDRIFDFALEKSGRFKELAAAAKRLPSRRVLVAGVAVPSRPDDMKFVVSQYKSDIHQIDFSIVDMGDFGKFENINRALFKNDVSAEDYDWIIITDDDVLLPKDFLDNFIAALEAGNFKIAMPAHRFRSYSSFDVTRRHWGALARRTHFVEIGPITAFSRDVVAALTPFPDLRWCWGLDVAWAQMARENNWGLGVIDATPITHTRPIARTYNSQAAVAEAKSFLADKGVAISRAEIMGKGDPVALDL